MTSASATGQGRQIVVAEDDEDIRLFVSIILAKEGFEIESFDSAGAVLDAVDATHPSLYLLDVRMPGTTGIELCRALRADPRFERSPILMMSAETSQQNVEAAMAAGADGYLPKPFSRAELITRVTALLDEPPA